jgi:hypothetical protein
VRSEWRVMARHLFAALAVAFAAAPALAASPKLEARTFTEPARPGLAVSGALSDYAATAKARVVVPATWRRLRAGAGALRFAVTQNPGCHYAVGYRVVSALGPSGSAADRVAAELPATGPRYLLDSGERGSAAFRVVRLKSAGGQVRVNALWAGVLTRRADIAPSGQVAWTEIHVSAHSRPGDECHSGTWRQALGPAIGDSLAVARAKLHFTRAS